MLNVFLQNEYVIFHRKEKNKKSKQNKTKQYKTKQKQEYTIFYCYKK